MIDGATYWQRVRRIILPLSHRTILLATLISAIGSMLAFDQFYLMTARRTARADLHLRLLDLPELLRLLQTRLRLGAVDHPDASSSSARRDACRSP